MSERTDIQPRLEAKVLGDNHFEILVGGEVKGLIDLLAACLIDISESAHMPLPLFEALVSARAMELKAMSRDAVTINLSNMAKPGGGTS